MFPCLRSPLYARGRRKSTWAVGPGRRPAGSGALLNAFRGEDFILGFTPRGDCPSPGRRPEWPRKDPA